MSTFRSNQNPPPLVLLPKSRVTLKKRVLPLLPKASLAASRIVKAYKPTYKPLSAPVPFFTSGRLNSAYDSASLSKEAAAQTVSAGVSKVAATRMSPSATLSVRRINDQNEKSDEGTSERLAEFTNNATNFENMIVETADIATQTHCQCECQCSSPDGVIQKTTSNQQLTREVAKLGYIIRDVATKITGKKAMDIEKFFLIASIAHLQVIQNHIEKTENFQLKLDFYLKHLIPPNSTNISFGLKTVVTDEFLYHKNWDGNLKQFGFFNSTLFVVFNRTTDIITK